MNKLGKPITQRQLRVGEMIKQALGTLFIRDEAKIPNLSTREITVTEVRMSSDLKTAKIFVIPLGGKNTEEIIENLNLSSFIIRKVLSKKMIKKIKELQIHEKDTGSSEVQIAQLTGKIETLSTHIKKFKKDKHSSVGLLKAVNRRKKLLEYLKKNKIESYKEVLTKLNLRK